MDQPKALKPNYVDYLQIALAFAMIAALCYAKDFPIYAYLPILAILFVATIVSKAAYKIISLPARCSMPVVLGLLFVAMYFQIYQADTFLDQMIKRLTDYDVKEFLSFAQFSESYKEQFYSAISTLFAIIIALALVKGIEDVDDTRKTLSEEAYGVRSVWNYLEYFEPAEIDRASEEAKLGIRKLLTSYACNVGARKDTKEAFANDGILKRCRAAVLKLSPADRDDEIAQVEIIKNLEAVGVLRSKRIGSAGSKVSGYLKGALWLMSLALILPFMAEPLCVDLSYITKQLGPNLPDAAKLPLCANGLYLNPQRFSQYYMIFITVSFFSFLMLMLHDVSSPDQGFWKVEPTAFKELHRDFQQDMASLQEETGGRPPGSAG